MLVSESRPDCQTSDSVFLTNTEGMGFPSLSQCSHGARTVRWLETRQVGDGS